MNVIPDTARLLTGAHYHVSPSSDNTSLLFEDRNIVGQVKEYDSISTLLSTWQKVQDGFVTTHANRLRLNPQKAWNIYTVHLCLEEPNTSDRHPLIAIEEDFRATRKIVGAGLQSMGDLQRSLMPLLPLQFLMELDNSDGVQRAAEVLESVDKRLGNLAKGWSCELVFDDLIGDQ